MVFGKMWRWATAALVCAGMIGARPAPARAADEGDGNPRSLTTTLVIVCPATTTTAIVERMVNAWTNNKINKMGHLLRENSAGVRAAITLGAGPMLEDLADALHVAPDARHAFGQRLRANRHALLAELARVEAGADARGFLALLVPLPPNAPHDR